MKLALAIQTPEVAVKVPVCLLEGSFANKCSQARALGIDGVELMCADPSQLNLSAIRQDLARGCLEVAAVGSGAVKLAAGLTLLNSDSGSTARAVERCAQLIDFAASIGSPLVTIGSFRGYASGAGNNGYQRFLEILAPLADHAQKSGVRIAVELLNRYECDFLNTAAEGLRFISDIAHPAVGLLLDTYHMNIEEPSFERAFESAASIGRLWHVHLGDNNRRAPGRGAIDFRLIIKSLRKAAYRGYLSAELLALPDPLTAAQQTAGYMRPLMEAAA